MSAVSRPRLLPAAATAVVALVCLALGVWQLERLAWKSNLIAERQAAVHAAPVPVPETLEEARRLEFHPVIAEGVFLNDKEIYLGAAAPGGGSPGASGTDAAAAERRPHPLCQSRLCSLRAERPEKRIAGQLSGPGTVSGLLRLPKGKPSWLVPDNRPDLNYWFWVDLPAMAAATHLSDVTPFYIDADATPNPGGWPKGGVTPIDLPNDHLQYAITWFALAAAAVVVYIVWRHQAGKTRHF